MSVRIPLDLLVAWPVSPGGGSLPEDGSNPPLEPVIPNTGRTLAQLILDLRGHFENPDEEPESLRPFLTSLAILVADGLAGACETARNPHATALMLEASRVIIDFVLKQIQTHLSQALTEGFSWRDLLHPLSALCSGSPSLSRSDQGSLAYLLSASPMPMGVQLVQMSGVSALDLEAGALGSGLPAGEPHYPHRPQTDLTSLLMGQLTSPVEKGASLPPNEAGEGDYGPQGRSLKHHFTRKNLQYMHLCQAGDVLIDLCASLPELSRYLAMWNEATSGDGVSLPASQSEASIHKRSFPQLASEIGIAWKALTIPLLEPLTNHRLQRLCKTVMGCLVASVSVATTQSILSLNANANLNTAVSAPNTGGHFVKVSHAIKEEDVDCLAVELIENSLELFNSVMALIRDSTRAGGHILQNFTMMGAWILSTGLLVQLTNTSQASFGSTMEKKDKGRGINLVKSQQGFGVLSVALGSQALTLMASLLSDLMSEVGSPDIDPEEGAGNKIEPATFDLFHPFTATQRVALVFKSVPFLSLMFNVATISYRKSCLFKHGLNKTKSSRRSGKSKKDIDLRTTTMDDIEDDSDDDQYHSSNEDDDDDDDSEPLLGKWIAETISNQEDPPLTAKEAMDQDEKDVNEKEMVESGSGNMLVPDRGEPTGFISLASHVFLFMNKHMLTVDSEFVKSYILANVSEAQLALLATIIRDLDKEIVNLSSMEYHLSSLYSEFSSTLSSLCHNLLACGYLNEHLQKSLLNQLNVSPWNMSSSWPLKVLPRTLAILAQTLLIRQNNESGLYAAKHTHLYIIVWEKTLGSLTERVTRPVQEDLLDDLNVEHAQFLLFLFHALTLMQKKQVLLLTARSIVKSSSVVNTEEILQVSQLRHLSRLILLLDYLMRNLYEPPKDLMEQVQCNIFKRYQNTSILQCPPKYYHFQDIEKSFLDRDESSDDEIYKQNPIFYNLLPTKDLHTSGDIPKLDGLACSFLLGTTDMLPYHSMYDSLIRILQVLFQADLRSDSKTNQDALLATHYCFQLTWRVLQSLPPSTEFLQSLMSPDQSRNMPKSSLIHALLVCPRTQHKNLGPWIRDSLVKQGVMNTEAETLIKAISTTINRVSHDIKVLQTFLEELQSRSKTDETPKFMDLILLDVIVAKIHISLDKMIQSKKSSQTELNKNQAEIFTSLCPILIELLNKFMTYSKSTILNGMQTPMESVTRSALMKCLSVSGNKCPMTHRFAAALRVFYPQDLWQSLKEWSDASLGAFPPNSTWNSLSAGSADLSPYDPYIHQTLKTHMSTLSSMPDDCKHVMSLKHGVDSLVRLYLFCQEMPNMQCDLAPRLFPVLLDISTENLAECTSLALESFLEEQNNLTSLVYQTVLGNVFEVLMNAGQVQTQCVGERILQEIVKFLDDMLEDPIGRKVLVDFLAEKPEFELVQIMLSIGSPHLSPEFTSKVLKLFNNLFEHADKNPSDPQIETLCSSLARLAQIPTSRLESWLGHLVGGSSAQITENRHVDAIHENRILLQSLSKFFVKDNTPIPEDVSLTILKCLLPMAQLLLLPDHPGFGFTDLMSVMATLANAGSGIGHVQLFEATLDWMVGVKKRLVNRQREKTDSCSVNDEKEKDWDWESPLHTGENASDMKERLQMLLVTNATQILSYAANIVEALILVVDHEGGTASSTAVRSTSPFDGESQMENDSDWMDDLPDDEDSGEEDSDDESLCNKLCTFTDTQKQFVQQHWYHCHTCKMVDGIGVCSICAKVCHADHDVTYSKCGSFFCDCGAKEDESCTALSRRDLQTQTRRRSDDRNKTSMIEVPPSLTSALRRREGDTSTSRFDSDISSNSSKKRDDDPTLKERRALAEKLAPWKESLLRKLQEANMLQELLDIIQNLYPVLDEESEKYSTIGQLAKTQKSLELLYQGKQSIDTTESIMLPTLGSQEGAFENVRMNFTGDQGNFIRQLMTGHMIRRVVMSCMSSGLHERRQYLVVSHEKGKIVILQLAALLKQSDSSQKKLTLTRLSSAPIPFTVLATVSNPINEDYLAVTGLKDCHVLTLNLSGSVTDHLVLHPQLDANNFIIKPIWMPGSQTELALVTADFVKIYNLGKDALSPEYFFLMPCGKIRDATLAFMDDGTRYILIMSSVGYIYYQALSDESLAQNGSFYVTSILEMNHPELADSSPILLGGGVSIYFSHTLRSLFFSYVQGKSFMAPLRNIGDRAVDNVFKLSESKSGSGKNMSSQVLCQWGEVPNHPGLVTAFYQTTNNPVLIMVRPDVISVQEIKASTKSKIVDMVVVRHFASTHQPRTTMILLCEDGSLKLYMANEEFTNFWMDQRIHPMSALSLSKPPRKKKLPKIHRSANSLSFPVDFFENCAQINDVEFGGVDVLQVYNVAQLKHRLNTSGLYIANTKPNGFNLEVTNNDPNQVIVGVRVMIGSQDLNKTPSFFEVFGRRMKTTPLSQQRWFDFPLSREESLQADKKITIFFGSLLDVSGVTIVDSVQVYGKTKEAFGWPEDQDETGVGPASAGLHPPITEYQDPHQTLPASPMENLIVGCLTIVDGYFHLNASMPNCQRSFDTDETQTCSDGEEEDKATNPSNDSGEDRDKASKEEVQSLCDRLITLSTAKKIEDLARSIMSSLFTNKQMFHCHKDQVLLEFITKDCFHDQEFQDVERFHRLILTIRSVVLSRPQNLVKFADTHNTTEIETRATDQPNVERQKFMSKLIDWFWYLLDCRPINALTGSLGQPGLSHVEATVQALVEILHGFTTKDFDSVPFLAGVYAKFLMAENAQVSFSTKQALIRVLRPKIRRRKVVIPTPPTCGSPNPPQPGVAPPLPPPPPAMPAQHPEDELQFHDAFGQNPEDADHHALNLGPGGIPLGGIAGNLDALLPRLGAAGHLHNVLDAIGGDVDDEAMVELAIALSLQEQQGDVDMDDNLQHGFRGLQQGLEQLANLDQDLQGLPALQGLAGLLGGNLGGNLANLQHHEGHGAGQNRHQQPEAAQDRAGAGGQDPNHFSDATYSVASDDEGSAMDGNDDNALRTPPVERDQEASGGGSESGGSVIESLAGESQTSARFGSDVAMPNETNAQTLQTLQEEDSEWERNNARLHSLRLIILDQLLKSVPELRELGGIRSIPFMQVLLMLTTDLNAKSDEDREILDKLLQVLSNELQMGQKWTEEGRTATRTPRRELQLVIMRLFSVLMSRSKSWQGGNRSANASDTTNPNFVSHSTAAALRSAGCIDHNLLILRHLLEFWKSKAIEDGSMKVGGSLLKAQALATPPDMSPFFLKQYVKGHAHDILEAYPQLLTEMALRLPYQIKKIEDSQSEKSPLVFDSQWHHILCEYMMTQQTPFVRRQVRKLLLYICGTKEKYRELRDVHSLESHMKAIQKIISQDVAEKTSHKHVRSVMNFSYDILLQLIEHFKACVDISATRTQNWQRFCLQNPSVLKFLFQISFILDDGVNPIVLQLLQNALCLPKVNPSPPIPVNIPNAAQRRLIRGAPRFRITRDPLPVAEDKARSEEPDEVVVENKADRALAVELVAQVNQVLQRDLLAKFVEKFLLECNASSVRWQAHALIVTLQGNSSLSEQQEVVDIFWQLWNQSPEHGHKAAQFVDLLGYFSMKTLTDETKVRAYIDEAVHILKTQNQILANHPNSNIYNSLSRLVDFSGYYLESDPCLVCNSPDVPYAMLKLSSLKVDTKYTTTTHIVKLSSSLSISKIALRIGDLKRQKMVRTINIYYNNRSVQAVVELKNKPTIWNRAKKVSLTAGQTDIKIEFPLPIVACNLMVEYADFYENIQASSETLQCPRCSASVPANPGVCSNCGENVFQCHKCRSINYDEKDPFLCNACGFCKYAKFEYTLTCRPCCAVDPIENEEDRKKAISGINTQLDKADKTYKQLIANKPNLETLLLKVSECCFDDPIGGSSMPTVGGLSGGGSNVNPYIQQLAQKYSGECKTIFEDLSKTIQKVMATRKELLAYDGGRRHGNKAKETSCSRDLLVSSGKCYGCAAASVEHCLTLLRALAHQPKIRHVLYEKGLIEELLEYNLRRGSVPLQTEVRKLITYLTKDNFAATEHLNLLLFNKVKLILAGTRTYPDLVESLRHEMSLLAYTIQKEDQCWEERLRCVMRIFLLTTEHEKSSPIVMECVTFPCLKILQSLVRPVVKFRRGKENKLNDPSSCPLEGYDSVAIDVHKWMDKDPGQSFQVWEKTCVKPKFAGPLPVPNKNNEGNSNELYLRQKYFRRWYERTFRKNAVPLEILPSSWLKRVLFNPTSGSAREVACHLVDNFCHVHERKRDILDLLTTYLDDLGQAGEFGADFAALYQRLITTDQWKHYLAIRGTLSKIADLMMKEIEKLNRQEETTLSTDLAQGFALKTFSNILSMFVAVDRIKGAYKGRLISTVLHGYLLLRRLVVQRTKLVDQTQERLLELLEDMTSGTVEETKSFMAVCVQTIRKYPKDDQLTPIFIFERLCNIIFPEETDTGEFFMTLEKDPQQEDFLQGRMVGNPYSSNDSDLGPLMREIKNKICRDCELVALLEDDNGMELLVNNKIISLDLPVKDVYQKVWLAEDVHDGAGEPMRIVYRMRGLLGDATEEFIESLESKDREDQDEEDVYKLANVMADCQGLEVILERLESVKDAQYSKQLLAVLLKLLGHCIKVKKNRSKLLDPSLKTIPILLGSLELCLASGETPSATSSVSSSSSGPSLSEQVLEIMEKLLVEAAANDDCIQAYVQFASNGVEPKTMDTLLEQAIRLKSGTNLHQSLMRVLPFLAYGHDDKMALIVRHFADVMNLDRFDNEHTIEDESKMEAFVVMCDGIERNKIGNTMKDQMISLDILGKCITYIKTHAPPLASVMTKNENPLWKEFVTRPSLKFILRAMAGLAVEHEPSQMLIADNSIPVLHQMEQVSSDEHVGSLAEAVLEALGGCDQAQDKVKAVRQQTKAEKKKLAMAMRAKQLKAIGLKTNDMGQVKADSSLLQQFGLAEESGLSCNICREGYKYQPNKVLAIYTFTVPCPVEEFEYLPRKTMGYSTVTHFNLVHVECHTAAVRQVRSRDEWESALLQNANTKCNGLLPLWGPNVAESAFATWLARHNTYLSEATHNQRDIGYQSTTHDLKLLLLRFAEDRSFSEESGGGGPQSNMHLVPYLIHMALYVLNTTRSLPREDKNLNSFLDLPKEKWLENAYVAEGPLYYATLCLVMVSPKRWSSIRIKILQRLLLTAHVRSIHPRPPKTMTAEERSIKDYAVYKKIILFFALIDQFFSNVFSGSISRRTSSESDWPTHLAEWIRKNDDALLKATTRVLSTFQNDLMPACSVDEIVDVCGLLEDIPSPASFLLEILSNM